MDGETIKLLSTGGVGIACLGTLIWVVRFTMTRLEVAIKDNTSALIAITSYLKRKDAYVSGGEYK